MQCLGRINCALGVGSSSEPTKDAGAHQKLNLSRALLLPSSQLRHRLVSVGKLTREGYGLMFIDDQGTIAKDGNVVAVVNRTLSRTHI